MLRLTTLASDRSLRNEKCCVCAALGRPRISIRAAPATTGQVLCGRLHFRYSSDIALSKGRYEQRLLARIHAKLTRKPGEIMPKTRIPPGVDSAPRRARGRAGAFRPDRRSRRVRETAAAGRRRPGAPDRTRLRRSAAVRGLAGGMGRRLRPGRLCVPGARPIRRSWPARRCIWKTCSCCRNIGAGASAARCCATASAWPTKAAAGAWNGRAWTGTRGAQGVYEKMGARRLSEWYLYRLTRDAMENVLKESD